MNTAFGASVVAVALIMLASTIICDIPDVVADRQSGVRGVTPWLGPRAGAITAVFYGLLGASVAGSVRRRGLAATALGLAWAVKNLVLQLILTRFFSFDFYSSLFPSSHFRIDWATVGFQPAEAK